MCIPEALWIFTVAVFLFSAMTGHIETEEIVALPVLWLQGGEITAAAGRTVGERKAVPGAFKGNASNTCNNLAWKVHGKTGALIRLSTQNAKAGVIVQGGA